MNDVVKRNTGENILRLGIDRQATKANAAMNTMAVPTADVVVYNDVASQIRKPIAEFLGFEVGSCPTLDTYNF